MVLVLLDLSYFHTQYPYDLWLLSQNDLLSWGFKTHRANICFLPRATYQTHLHKQIQVLEIKPRSV